MFAKSFGSDNNLGDRMLKSSFNDKGSKPAKHEASNTTDNVQTSTKKQLKNEPSNTLEMVSAMEKELRELGPSLRIKMKVLKKRN